MKNVKTDQGRLNAPRGPGPTAWFGSRISAASCLRTYKGSVRIIDLHHRSSTSYLLSYEVDESCRTAVYFCSDNANEPYPHRGVGEERRFNRLLLDSWPWAATSFSCRPLSFIRHDRSILVLKSDMENAFSISIPFSISLYIICSGKERPSKKCRHCHGCIQD
jgi:hypothetical protein